MKLVYDITGLVVNYDISNTKPALFWLYEF